MWDLAEDGNSIKLLESLVAAGESLALVCYSTSARRRVKSLDGKRFVTAFTNGEEDEVELTKVIPFLAENGVMRLGAIFSKVRNRGVHVVADDQLSARQNPASSGTAAKLQIDSMNKNAK
jgi:hypothetical protein